MTPLPGPLTGKRIITNGWSAATHDESSGDRVTDLKVGDVFTVTGSYAINPPRYSDGMRIYVFDNALHDPCAYRIAALAREFGTVDVGAKFHGIALGADATLAYIVESLFPALKPQLSFFRQSHAGQPEPNFIHTDCDMGDWTAILYLTPNPPMDDGTTFWRHRQTGAIETRTGATSEQNLAETLAWRDRSQWEPWRTVAAVFNRVVVFPACYYHSRALEANYGTGEHARLTQVLFGTGTVPEGAVCR